MKPEKTTLNPWYPTTDPLDLMHLGKLAEELGEASAAVARCIIQRITEAEPVTGKPNKEWLEDELADVYACAELVIEHFSLNIARMVERSGKKRAHLREWHRLEITKK